jgi:hypothetical protein
MIQLIALPDVDHRSLGTDWHSSTNGTRTRKELDAERREVEHVMHDRTIQKSNHFRYAGATCRLV